MDIKDNSEFTRNLNIIKRKTNACDRCRVPGSAKYMLHIGTYLTIFCDECYKFIEYPEKGYNDPRNKEYPHDLNFWITRETYGDVIDFSLLVDSDGLCSTCKKTPYRWDFHYHMYIKDGKVIKLECDDCYTNANNCLNTEKPLSRRPSFK